MAAVTAHFQIGYGHPNQGGLRTLSTVRLEEGGRAALTFKGQKGPTWPNELRPPVIIPATEFVLEDALLLIAYTLRLHPEIDAMLDEIYLEKLAGHSSRQVDTTSAIGPGDRNRLYLWLSDQTVCQWPKLGLCVYRGSALLQQAHRLGDYVPDYEVLLPAYGREFSAWTGGYTEWGDRPTNSETLP